MERGRQNSSRLVSEIAVFGTSEFELDPNGHLTLEELPGERERVSALLEMFGIKR